MDLRKASRVASWIGGSAIILMTAGLLLMFVDRSAALPGTASPWDWTFANALAVVANIVGVAIGTLVAVRRPDNRVGWFFMAAGVTLGISTFGGVYAAHALLVDPGTWPGGRLAAWFTTWTNFLPVYMLAFIFLLFPTGRVRSRRWQPVWWLLVAATTVATITGIVYATSIWNDPFVEPDIGSGSIVPFLLLFLLPYALSLIASLAAVIVRAIYSNGDERLQIKWFATGAVLVVLTFVISFLVGGSTQPAWITIFQSVALIFLFAAIGIAVLKYRLYDIDVVINRAVVYGTLAVFITLIYAGLVVGVGTLVGNQGDRLLTAIAAAVIAIAFQPIRERSRRFANRLVYGTRATPYEVLADFAERVAGTYSVEDVLPRTAHMLAEGTAASRADVWVRVGPELRAAGSWPTAVDEYVSVGDGEEISVPGSTATAPVRYQGRLLGGLSVTKAPGEQLTATEAKLLADVASQAGLVLRNAGLIEELRASRQRLVAAQDEERRKIERNLHDGVQQQLVALNVQLGLLARTVERDPSQAGAMSAQLQSRASEALDDLRDLARGIYPPLLADKGLGAALEAQARKAALPVTVEADGVGRYEQPVEAAVYFCTLEALNNVAKYAGATHAAISLRQRDGVLAFTVTDDGAGFDMGATRYGTGLQGMADRLDAIGGVLDVTSTPGTGTSVSGSVPAPTA
jgi:signal transduction histidine kinase